MKTFLTYFFVIGTVISIVLFSIDAYFAGCVATILTWCIPGLYLVYKSFADNGPANPFGSGPFGSSLLQPPNSLSTHAVIAYLKKTSVEEVAGVVIVSKVATNKACNS